VRGAPGESAPFVSVLVAVGALLVTGAAGIASGCNQVDDGPDFVVADEQFDGDYFFCHVEPQLLFDKHCGDGDPSQGDPTNGCHYNSSAVSGMALQQHAPIDCGGGDHPVDTSMLGSGGAAQTNYQSASLEMSTDYTTAPIYVRPTGNNHPRQIFTPTDPVVQIIATWASTP
jgi:hypothetical protein